jgi:multisubunit Na+/H+ antiporter MnhB subunit
MSISTFTAYQPRTASVPVTELALYADGLVLLTNRRVVFGSRTYWLKNVKTADVVRVTPRKRMQGFLFYVPFVLAYLAFMYLPGGRSGDGLNGALLYGGLALVALGAAFTALRLRRFRSATVCYVRLNNKSRVLASLDERYAVWLAARIVGAWEGATETAEVPFPEVSQAREPGENLYYSDGYAWVTSDRVRLGSREYGVGGIRRVAVGQLPSERFQWHLVLAVSLLVLSSVLNYLWFTSVEFRRDYFVFYPGDYWILSLILSVGFLALLLWTLLNVEEATYVLQLRGSTGKANVFASMDSYYCKRLTEVIKSVMRERGRSRGG